MQPEVTLLVRDEAGAARPVRVASSRFVIGSDPDNDLVLVGPYVARRHALIESLDGVVELSGYSSHGVTALNGAEINRPVRLSDGDLITLGGLEVEVRIRAAAGGGNPPRTPGRARDASKGPPRKDVRGRTNAEPSSSKGRADSNGRAEGPTLPAVALSAAIALLVVGGLALFLSRRQSQTGNDGGPRAAPTRGVNKAPEPGTGGAQGSGGGAAEVTATPSGTPEVSGVRAVRREQVKKDSTQLVRRISNDSRSYSFPDQVLEDIRKKVEEYGRDAAALRAAFASLRRGGEQLARQARAEGVPPDLAIYAGLARPEGGRALPPDPLAAAREALPPLALLRKKLGGDTDEGSLIVVAAYYEGAGTKKSHPLLLRLGRTDANFAKRNVWHLRDEHIVGEQTYDFLIRFLALGAVGQDPRQYGVEADPLLF